MKDSYPRILMTSKFGLEGKVRVKRPWDTDKFTEGKIVQALMTEHVDFVYLIEFPNGYRRMYEQNEIEEVTNAQDH